MSKSHKHKKGNNRTVRKQLEEIYGEGCFFMRAHCAQRIKAMGNIKTFKKFLKETKYRGLPISFQITYHHLKHKSEGGKTDIENGANVADIAHKYMHSLPREQEEVINDMIREFKLGFGKLSTKGLEQTGVIDLDFGFEEEDSLTIPVYSCTREEFDKLMQENKRREQKSKKYRQQKNPTRAMREREKRKIIEEENDEQWR